MDIRLGTQLCVDQAYKCLIPDIRYYYLGPWNRTSAILAFFHEDGEYWRVANIRLDREEFEILVSPDIRILRCCETQLQRPQWMADHQSTNFNEIEEQRYKSKKVSHEDRVVAKIASLGAALIDQILILATEDPRRALAPYAKEAGVHPYRFETQYFAYILHGKDRWTLMTRWFGNGQWNREAKGKKFGRKALARNYSFNFPLTTSLRAKIIAFAMSSKDSFISFTDFHDKLLINLGCSRIIFNGCNLVYHEKNEPFPSRGQAYRTVFEALTDEEYASLFSRSKSVRPKRPYNLGNFTNQFACNLEAIESDGFYVKDVLKSFISERPTAKMVVVRTICSTTSCRVGVGFSIGGEKKEAYRTAFYCMVAPRDFLEKLFGLDSGSLKNWVSGGLSAFSTTDRGPAAWGILAQELEATPPLQTIAPTQEPLSKALSEASHPRHHDNALDHTYRESALTVAGVMKRELLRAARDNESSDIGPRLSDVMRAEFHALGLPTTPQGFWTYNKMKGRDAGDSTMSHHEAVRTFWSKITVKLCRDGVMHRDSPYRSQELIDSGIMENLALSQQTELNAYALACAVGYLFIEVQGQLIEVTRVHRLRLNDDDYSQTEEELSESQRNASVLRSERRNEAVAVRLAYNLEAVAQTGDAIDGGRTRHGRKPGGHKMATGETSAIRRHTKS